MGHNNLVLAAATADEPFSKDTLDDRSWSLSGSGDEVGAEVVDSRGLDDRVLSGDDTRLEVR